MKFPSKVPTSSIPLCAPTLTLLDSSKVACARFDATFKVNIYSLIKPSEVTKKRRSQYWRRKHVHNWAYLFTILTRWSMDYRTAKKMYTTLAGAHVGGVSYLIFPQPHTTSARPDFYNNLVNYRLIQPSSQLRRSYNDSITFSSAWTEGLWLWSCDGSGIGPLPPQVPFALRACGATVFVGEGGICSTPLIDLVIRQIWQCVLFFIQTTTQIQTRLLLTQLPNPNV